MKSTHTKNGLLNCQADNLRWKKIGEEEGGSESNGEWLVSIALYRQEGIPGGGQITFISTETVVTKHGSTIYVQTILH